MMTGYCKCQWYGQGRPRSSTPRASGHHVMIGTGPGVPTGEFLCSSHDVGGNVEKQAQAVWLWFCFFEQGAVAVMYILLRM